MQAILYTVIPNVKKMRVMSLILGLMGLILAVGISFTANVLSDRIIYVSDHPDLITVHNIASMGAKLSIDGVN